MKIVDRKTFFLYPPETLYMKYYGMSGDGLMIKGDTIGNDWFYADLLTIWSPDDNSSDDLFKRLNNPIIEDFEQDLEGIQRDGMYDEDEMFIIYQKKDIEKLLYVLGQL